MNILKWFQKEKGNNPNVRIYDLDSCNTWGNTIRWLNYDTQSIVGHQQIIPRIGDYILSKMQSGVTAKFVVTQVEQCRNPSDMFIANVKRV